MMEYVDCVLLDEYLKQNMNMQLNQKIEIINDCACGMEYLEKKRIVHGYLRLNKKN